jgi:DNA-binding transcriptional regulator GbsR (MarR family)
MQIRLNEKQKALIEKFGVFFEKHHGLSPAQARIVGLLMICDRAELTFEEICQLLHLSKSAVSTALNSLLMMGRIEYYTKPGDRKRYFYVNALKSESDNDSILTKLSGTADLYREILAARSKSNPKYNSELKRWIEFIDFIHTELSEGFKKRRKAK